MKTGRWVLASGVLALVAAIATATATQATHSWGSYHWARTVNQFTLKLGDNVSSAWDAYLAEASGDWTESDVLNTQVVSGGAGNPALCLPTEGRVEVCSAKYGATGWLGIAQIWADAQSHITQARVGLNDTYFSRGTYNTPAWRRFVVCQEVGHTFGLDHQDEIFSNPNLGSCMDYTDDPDGGPGGASNNEHPNGHDYEQLGTIYAGLDTYATVDSSAEPSGDGGGGNGKGKKNGGKPVSLTDRREWGRLVSGVASGPGGVAVFQRDFASGEKVFTFVIWA